MTAQNLADATSDGVALLRNEPVQARSAARLTALLDAAASIIDEIGYERLTTAMVAERAGASIGTVYRYFPDRIVVLQSLSARYLQTILERINGAVKDEGRADWWQAVSAAVDVVVEAFRSETGYRSLRLGDVLDVHPAASAHSGGAIVAESIAAVLVERFDLPEDDLAFRLEVVLDLTDALLARAFANGGPGEERFIQEARTIAHDYLVTAYGEPTDS
ncbi:MAG TPA: TetR/AcrR family transcriptional regulator [Lacisediminihabitans sp.]|uniref:TetR/AcrR family transcriptional regulator n=1 Tax=Lacisediminihabitans sp. TaxID=2787631 RepID=UPI002EDA51C6